MENIYAIIGAAMKKVRKERKLKAKTVAAMLDLEPANFSAYEAGTRKADVELLVRWCDALGVRLRFPLEKYDEIRFGGRKAFRNR